MLIRVRNVYMERNNNEATLSSNDNGGNCIGDHLFPFRTEKLRPIAPMVLE